MKIYWSEQSLNILVLCQRTVVLIVRTNGLVPEDRCSSWELNGLVPEERCSSWELMILCQRTAVLIMRIKSCARRPQCSLWEQMVLCQRTAVLIVRTKCTWWRLFHTMYLHFYYGRVYWYSTPYFSYIVEVTFIIQNALWHICNVYQ
jgi:hypothetical protein